MAFHRVEFTDFTTALPVHTFCCTGPLPPGGRTGVTRYTALWCPDFPPHAAREAIRGPVFYIKAVVSLQRMFFLHVALLPEGYSHQLKNAGILHSKSASLFFGPQLLNLSPKLSKKHHFSGPNAAKGS